MIHFFEGWDYPGKTTGAIDTTGLVRMLFASTNTFSVLGDVAPDTARAVLAVSNTSNCFLGDVITAGTGVLGDKLVIGAKVSVPTTSQASSDSGILFGATTTSSTPRTNAPSGTFRGIETTLPLLLINASEFVICVPTASITVTSQVAAPTAALLRITTAGIDVKVPHFYEIEYDRLANLITLYVDGVAQGSVAWDFSAVPSTSEHRAMITAMYRRGTASASQSATSSLGTIYLADSVLGPVVARRLPAAADNEISDSFGAGPHYPQVDKSPDATSTNGIHTQTTSTATAVFGLQDVEAETPVLAVSTTVRVSSEHTSAERYISSFTPIINVNGSAVQAGGDIPEQAFRDFNVMMSNNPVTSSPWTASDLNALEVGGRFDSRPRSE